MSTQVKARLTEGSVFGTLVRLSIPMLIGLIAGMTYGIADSYWIGQLGGQGDSLGSIQQAALTQIYQIDFFLIKLALGLGIGVTVVVSQTIGKGEWEYAQKITLSAIALAFLLAIGACIAGLVSMTPLFTHLGVEPQVLVYIKKYMFIWYPSVIFMIAPVILNSTMRAAGNAAYPGMIMLLGSLLNLILDPFLIFGIGFLPHMGIAGAATATLISRFITFILAIVFARKIGILDFKALPFHKLSSLWNKIGNVAIPTTLTQIIAPIGGIIMVRLINTYGPFEAAGYGPAFKIEIFFIAPLMALGAMIGPFTGQNLGAEKYDRIFEALKKSILFATIWGVIVAIILYIIRKPLAPMFNDNEAAYWSFRFYLAITSWSVAAIGINAIWLQFLNATGRQRTGTILTLIQFFGITLPLALWAVVHQHHIAWVYTAVLIGHYTGLVLFSIFGLRRVGELSGRDAPIIRYIAFAFLAFGLIIVFIGIAEQHFRAF
ncbi:MAG: MATE family efflux transporter [Alphaproteobacteria bacterium]